MMSPVVQIFAFTILAWFFLDVDAFSNGQVNTACSSMMPEHGAPTQASSPPYILTSDKSTYSPGEQITVTLNSSTGSTPFKGLLIQARSGSNTTPLGTFQVTTTDVQTLSCENVDASAVSHKSSSGKTSVQVTWIAPTSTTADIQFTATVVQTSQTFWTNVVSSKLFYMAVASNTNDSTTSTTTTTANSISTRSTTTTTATTISTGSTTITTAKSSSTTPNFQAFLLLCVAVVVSLLIQ